MEDDSYEKSFEICEKSDFKEYLKDEKSLVFRHYDSPFEKDVPFDFLKEAISKNKQLSFSKKEIKKISYEWIRNNTCKEENCQYHKECFTCVFDSLEEEYSEEQKWMICLSEQYLKVLKLRLSYTATMVTI